MPGDPLITLEQDAISSIENLIMQYSKKGIYFLLSSHQDFGQAAINIQSTYVIRGRRLYYGNKPARQLKYPA